MTDVRRIDQLNLGLVLLSLAIAHIVPIELLVIVYIFLGPAHYLTEISWLHERQYFTKARWDYLVLAALSLSIFLLFDLGVQYIILIAVFFLAISMALSEKWPRRLAVTTICSLVVFGLIVLEIPVDWFFVFLPNMIHIVVFTSIFILVGALRNNSAYGFATLIGLLLGCLTFVLPTTPVFDTTQYGLENIGLIKGMYDGLFELFGVNMTDPVSRNILGFVAFANTYHYLNWFSKTGVVRWHDVPQSRMLLVLVVYLASIGLYLYDVVLGFKVLLLLSFLHVVLEFPLNTLSSVEAGRLIKKRLSPAT